MKSYKQQLTAPIDYLVILMNYGDRRREVGNQQAVDFLSDNGLNWEKWVELIDDWVELFVCWTASLRNGAVHLW